MKIKSKTINDKTKYNIYENNINIATFTLIKINKNVVKEYFLKNDMSYDLEDIIFLLSSFYRNIDDNKYIKQLKIFEVPNILKDNENPINETLKKKIIKKINKFRKETKIAKNLTLDDIKGIPTKALNKIFEKLKRKYGKISIILHPIRGYKKESITYENFYKTNEERENDLLNYYSKHFNMKCVVAKKYIERVNERKAFFCYVNLR